MAQVSRRWIRYSREAAMSDFAVALLLGAGWIILAIAGLRQELEDGRTVVKRAQDVQRLQGVTRQGYGQSWSLWVRGRRDL